MKKKIKILLSVIFITAFIFSLGISYLYISFYTRPSESEEKNPYYYFFLFNPKKESNIPQGVRLTVLDGLNNSIGISWFTIKNASDPKILVSTNFDLANKTSLEANVSNISDSFVYYAKLNNLASNTTYFFQVCSDNENKTEIMNFRTMPSVSNYTRFIVYGDSRTLRTERNKLAQKINDNFLNQIDFSIHTGDIIEDGRIQDQWNNYFLDTEMLNAYKQGIYVEGNHERGSNTKMYDNLLMNSTADKRYYAFPYNDLGFIILNSNSEAVDNKNQTDWLNQTLFEYSRKYPFNFVYLHHPLLHSRIDPYFQEKWCPLIDKYNASIIFCGHNHHYERSFPMINSTALNYNDSERYNYSGIADPIYIVTGGAGAPLYPTYGKNFSAYEEKAYHFIFVEIKKEMNKTVLSLEAWGMPEDFGELYMMDNITITKLN
jgi:predicted phosphodiesterase